MERKITFDRDELTLVGKLFTPDDFDETGRYHAVVVQGSFSSVKEQMAETYARKFAEAGFVALAFDYSHYGESDGQPRQLESPAEKLSDLQAAVTYLGDLPFVQAVAMVGVCTSAGNAAYLAAADPRLKAMATVAGMLPDPNLFRRVYGDEGITARLQDAAAAQLRYETTGAATTIPTYSETKQTAANYNPEAGAYDYYLNPSRGGIPTYINELDVTSWPGWLAFDPISRASAITTPTMVVHSEHSAFPDQARMFYALLQGPKELVWAEGNHFDYYDNPARIDNAVKNVTRFFNEHLA